MTWGEDSRAQIKGKIAAFLKPRAIEIPIGWSIIKLC